MHLHRKRQLEIDNCQKSDTERSYSLDKGFTQRNVCGLSGCSTKQSEEAEKPVKRQQK